jgi:hypothetical protein
LNRPVGVTLSALYKFASGLVWMVVSFWYTSSFKQTTGGAGLYWERIAIVGSVSFVPAVWFISVGIGLWRMKNWARILVLVVGAFWTAEFLLKLPEFLFQRTRLVEHWYYWLALLWPGPVLNIVILIYLMLPHVQRSFRESGLPKV